LLVGTVPIGQTVRVKILRNGFTSELPLTVVRSDEEKLARASLKQEAFGLKLEDLTPSLAQELDLRDSHGLVVSAIRPGSAAERSGLRVRDVILEVNRKPIESLSSYDRALKSGGRAKIDLLLVRRDKGTLFIPLKHNE
jgi:serine protease Do